MFDSDIYSRKGREGKRAETSASSSPPSFQCRRERGEKFRAWLGRGKVEFRNSRLAGTPVSNKGETNFHRLMNTHISFDGGKFPSFIWLGWTRTWIPFSIFDDWEFHPLPLPPLVHFMYVLHNGIDRFVPEAIRVWIHFWIHALVFWISSPEFYLNIESKYRFLKEYVCLERLIILRK